MLGRWAARALTVGTAIGLAAVAFVLWLGENLDRPWVKGHVQSLVRGWGGVDIDYEAMSLRWSSGLEIEGLVVRSPPDLRGLAPDLLRAGKVEAGWSRASLFGSGPRVERLSVEDVTLTVVVDEQGRTSFDDLGGPNPVPPPPPVPLSRQAGAALAGPPPVGRLEAARVQVVVVSTEGGIVRERDILGGLVFAIQASPLAPGWRIHLDAGKPDAPLDLDLRRESRGAIAGTARMHFWLDADASASTASASLGLKVAEQSFVTNLGTQPALADADWLHAEATARFDPHAGRTTIAVERTSAAGGAATAEASLEIPDHGDLLVRHAQGDVDAGRLLAWAPAGLAPVTAERAQIRYRIDSLLAGPTPRFADGGSLAVDADVVDARVRLASGSVVLGSGKLTLQGKPAPEDGLAAQGSAQLDGLRVEVAGDRIAAQGITVDLDVQQAKDGTLTGRAGVRFAGMRRDAAPALEARDGRVDARVEGLRVDPADPFASRGEVTLSGAFAAVDLRGSGARLLAEGLEVRAHSRLEGHPPYAVDLEAPAARLRVFGHGGLVQADGPARIEAHLHDAVLDRDRPIASKGVLQASATLADAQVSLDATKETDSVDYALQAHATTLKGLRPLLSPTMAQAGAWDTMGLDVRSSGKLGGIAGPDPDLQEDTAIVVDRPALEPVKARSLSLDLHSKGTASRQQIDATLQAHALAVAGVAGMEGGATADDRVVLSATLDRTRPSLQLNVATEGRARSKIAASVSFDRSRRAIVYDTEGTLAGLEALAPLVGRVHGLEGFNLSGLELGWKSRGTVLGLVSGVSPDSLDLEPHPSRTAGLEGTADVHVGKLRWSDGETSLEAPAATWHGDFHVAGARRTVDSQAEAEALHLVVARHAIDVAGIADTASASVTGDLLDPESELTQRLTAREVQQDFAPGYPIGDFDFTLTAERDTEGLIRVSEMKVGNAAGGTALALTGGVDLGVGRRRLSMTADVSQDLSTLCTDPTRFAGRGKLSLEAKVESPDLTIFRTRVDLKAEGVNLRVPGAGVNLESFDGEIPITAAIEVGKNGVSMRRDARLNPYSMLRFADQHALLRRSGFLSIGRLDTPLVSIAPLVGNLEVEQNVISLRQFEMGIRGGRITGECALDYEGKSSTLDLHVRASGVRSSHGEPFDGNIAVVIAAADRTIEGRAEILRIGPRHLLDLLDLEDPMRVDPAMNRVRSALAFGYPDRLRLVFDHGFASARLQLGGLARLVSIGEMRGIPMGPIVDRFLSPILDRKETP